MSLANLNGLKLLLCSVISLVYTENSTGDKTQPCGAPVFKTTSSESTNRYQVTLNLPKYCDNNLTQCESQSQGEQQVSQLSITAVNQRPHGRHQSYYKSSNLINGAIISKMTTSTLIRGPKFSDWDHNDLLKKMIDLVFLERSWRFLNGNQMEPASSSRW